jgi:hypothetical protein
MTGKDFCKIRMLARRRAEAQKRLKPPVLLGFVNRPWSMLVAPPR